MTEYYRCPENHLLKRVRKRIEQDGMRTKCGWCHKIVTVVPCPEATPPKTARRNPFAPSIMRQRNSGKEILRRAKYLKGQNS